jgi:dipeptidyl aminopeptidase/acylaminoacyl peptidase
MELQAVLLYPAGYDATRTYPMIVYTYERLSDNVHNYVVPSERSYYNLNVFTANDYFVLLPDIVYRGRDPGISALEAVESAVQTVLDRGIVDPARVGLVGHSWGGYQATYLPTRTDIFAAAVACAPITNFLSFAGAIHWNPGIAEFDHWETGQARMGVPPWEDFDAYLRNSPIHEVDQLDTPMLMMFGDADGVVDWHQGIEFYNFARRAGVDDFVLLVYPGEDHGLRKKENQIDYHRRILEWFGHWLKDEPAPAWIAEGVTWLDRKKTLDRDAGRK